LRKRFLRIREVKEMRGSDIESSEKEFREKSVRLRLRKKKKWRLVFSKKW
jgi:hypothetical protein